MIGQLFSGRHRNKKSPTVWQGFLKTETII